MQKIVCLIVILICINTFCFAEEKQEGNKTKKENEYSVGVYLHPVSFVLAQIINLPQSSALLLYATIEIPTSPSFSFIIRPSLLDDLPGMGGDIEWFRVGTDLGIRYYTNGKGNGLYLQGTVGLFNSKRPEYNTHYYSTRTDTVSFFQADIMVYIGASVKPNRNNSKLYAFVDLGIGYGSSPFVLGLANKRIDYNIGVGYRF